MKKLFVVAIMALVLLGGVTAGIGFMAGRKTAVEDTVTEPTDMELVRQMIFEEHGEGDYEIVIMDDQGDGYIDYFVFDENGLETEVAQINAVVLEYEDLQKGNLPDVEKTYNEYMEKLKKAGLDKVKAEMQKQIDEFFKNKK